MKLKSSNSSRTYRWYVQWLCSIYVLLLLTSACSTSKRMYMFETTMKDTTVERYISQGFESKIRKGDNLGISINSLSQEENARFNSTIITGTGEQSKTSIPGYLVSNEGTIKMYRLGEIKVEGMTRAELATKLQKDLAAYLKEPLVSVSYLNRKVTVLGSVARPSVINLSDEEINIFEALAIAGDVKVDSRIDNVLVIREKDNVKEFKRINLRDYSIVNSPWYYLQADDILYVSPDYLRQERDERRRNMQVTLSLVATGVSLIFLLLNRIL